MDRETEHYDPADDYKDHMAYVDLDKSEAQQNPGERNEA